MQTSNKLFIENFRTEELEARIEFASWSGSVETKYDSKTGSCTVGAKLECKF